MSVSEAFGRWTATNVSLAVAGVLAIAGAVGSALAISPIIAPPIQWAGGVNIVEDVVVPGTRRLAYTVPAGRSFMLTDIVISNDSATPASSQGVFTGSGTCLNNSGNRTSRLTVPAGGSLHLPFVTGLGFSAGQLVCIGNFDPDSETEWMMRGFLFTPAPAS